MSTDNMEFCLKMSPCKCNSGGDGATLPDLSYEEQEAGFRDWDGKKVYVKSVKIDSFPNGLNAPVIKNIPHGIHNFEKLIDCRVCYHQPSTGHYVVGNASGNDSYSNIHITAQNIELWVKGHDRRNDYGVAILYYTCTDR